MEINVYIDGFNLFYGLKRHGSGSKWLDIQKLAETLFPNDTVKRVRYFTARVEGRPGDLQKPARQDIYLQALVSLPKVTIHEGQYRSDLVRMYSPSLQQTIDVIKTEEKGSDVNLATFLLVDGFHGDYEQAVVVSNDSDLKQPVRVVMDGLHLPVVLLNPGRWPNKNLTGTSYRPIRAAVVKACQLPPVIQVTTKSGRSKTLARPSGW